MKQLIDDHVKFYIYKTPAIDVADFCKKYGYEMYIGDDEIWIQKVDEVAYSAGVRSGIEYCKSLIDNNDEEPGKIDQTAVRLTNLTFMAHLLTTEELLELRKIITKELLTRPDYMRKKILGTIETPIPEEERNIKILKKIRKYCNRFENCDGCELKTANAQDVEICIFNAPPCSWLDPEIEKVNEVLKENKE